MQTIYINSKWAMKGPAKRVFYNAESNCSSPSKLWNGFVSFATTYVYAFDFMLYTYRCLLFVSFIKIRSTTYFIIIIVLYNHKQLHTVICVCFDKSVFLCCHAVSIAFMCMRDSLAHSNYDEWNNYPSGTALRRCNVNLKDHIEYCEFTDIMMWTKYRGRKI